MNHFSKTIALCLVSFFPFSCGQSDEREETGSTSLTSTAVSSESVSTSLSDALELLSDSNINSSSASFALQGSEDPLSFDRTKSCAIDGDNAVVSIEGTLEGSVEFSTARASISREVSGSSSIIRTWSKTDDSVLCNSDNTYAAINWGADDISGLGLEVTIDRSKSVSATRTKLSDESVVSRSKSYSASGNRSVSWISHNDNGDGTFTRVKSISSSMSRSSEIDSSDGENVSLSLSVATVEGSELQVTVVRDSTTRELQSKLISSGSLRASEDSQAYVITSFEDYLINFSDDGCTPFSGKLTSNFYEEGTEEAIKTLELTVDNGSYTLMDITDNSSY